MRNLLPLLSGILLLSSFSNSNLITTDYDNEVVELTTNSFILMNDVNQKVSINTDNGSIHLFNGSTTRINCSIGNDITWGNKSREGEVIFKITDNMCGNVVKLSDLINYL